MEEVVEMSDIFTRIEHEVSNYEVSKFIKGIYEDKGKFIVYNSHETSLSNVHFPGKASYFRDIDLVMDVKNNLINYSRLCYELTDDEDSFENLMSFNPEITRIIYSYEFEKFHKHDVFGIEAIEEEIARKLESRSSDKKKISPGKMFIKMLSSGACNYGIFKTRKPWWTADGTDMARKVAGVYGPRYLLHPIISIINPNYCRLINELMEKFDKYIHPKSDGEQAPHSDLLQVSNSFGSFSAESQLQRNSHLNEKIKIEEDSPSSSGDEEFSISDNKSNESSIPDDDFDESDEFSDEESSENL